LKLVTLVVTVIFPAGRLAPLAGEVMARVGDAGGVVVGVVVEGWQAARISKIADMQPKNAKMVFLLTVLSLLLENETTLITMSIAASMWNSYKIYEGKVKLV